MITMTGSEFKRFYKEPLIWVDGVSWDDTHITVNGDDDEDIDLENVADTAVVQIDNGYLVNPSAGVPEDLEDAITWWRAKQATTEFLLRVPNEKVAAVKQALALLGIEIAVKSKASRAVSDASWRYHSPP